MKPSDPEDCEADPNPGRATEHARTLGHLREIPSAEWVEIIKRLTLFAADRLAQLRWEKGFSLQGREPKDLAQGAIEKVWNGTRRWDRKKYPDLLPLLKDIVRSDSNHLAESAEHRTCQPRLVIEEGGSDPIENLPGASPNPEQELTAKELARDMYRRIGDDPDLRTVLTWVLGGYSKPQDIARKTGFSDEKVYALLRKLRRRLNPASRAADEGSAHA